MSFHQGGRAGVTAWFVVTNRAQRCEIHKPAVFGGWEGRGLACEFRTYAVLIKTISCAIFEDLPPTQRCVDSVYS